MAKRIHDLLLEKEKAEEQKKKEFLLIKDKMVKEL